MRRFLLSLTFVLMIVTLLSLSVVVHASNKIVIAVSIPVEKYILSQALGNIVSVRSLLSGEYEPHLQEVTRNIISQVLRSDLYVPVYHFEFEYRLISVCSENNIPVVKIDLRKLVLLRFPHTSTVNMHGWWLLPENALYLANSTVKILEREYPELASYLEARLSKFVHDIERIRQILSSFGNQARRLKNLKNVLLVCSPPAEYMVAALNLTCDVVVSERTLSSKTVLILSRHQGPILALLANFQRGSAIDRLLSSMVSRKGGAVLYIPFIGLRRYNMTYTEYMLTYEGEILGALAAVRPTVSMTRGRSSSANLLLYVCILLGTLLVMSLIVNISLLRRS